MAFDDVYVIGDSLVDAGNALGLAEWYGTLTFSDLPDGAPVPELGYVQGRFTNGFTFADLISNKLVGGVTDAVFPYGFDDPWLGVPIVPFLSDPDGNALNFAYGGAQIIRGREVVPDLDEQTDALKDAVDNSFGSNDLVMVTLGGNDIRSLVPSGGATVPEAEAHAALDDCAQQLLHELSQLIDAGAEHILITGIPDVGLIPRYDRDGNRILDPVEQQRADAATDYSVYLDTLVRTEVVPALQAMGATITYVPLMDHLDAAGNLVEGALNANLPTIEALHGLPAGTLSSDLLQHQNLLFFDGLHPNAQAHALLGAYMHAELTGAAWIETLPLMGRDVDYRLSGRIASAGEVDKLVFSLVAGTTYRFDMLGVSSLGTAGTAGTAGTVGDTALRLLGPGGTVIGSDDDSGAGFDATLSFTAATSGSYTLELSAIGHLTGTYALRTAAVEGAAMAAGNTYTVNSSTLMIIEGRGGVGQDVVRTSVSYVLGAGSEVEVLRTTNNKGTATINLTGNEFNQTLIGNSGSNVLDGRSGADVMTGGAGSDRFVLSATALTRPTDVDTITDYARGDVVDVSQILKVAAGTDIGAGGYLRVTSGGLIQADVDGGGDDWVTLSTVNGTGSVTLRYLSGGRATDVMLPRVSASESSVATADASAVRTEPLQDWSFQADLPDPMSDMLALRAEALRFDRWHIESFESFGTGGLVTGALVAHHDDALIV